MNKLKYFGSLSIIFSILLCVSIWIDSKRMIESAKNELEAVDVEVRKQEQRYLQSLSSLFAVSTANQRDFESYQNAKSIEERRQNFSKIKPLADGLQLDISNPAVRRLLDEMNGALNRISRLETDYSKATTDYQNLCNAWQGMLAGC
jgi:hypothetical protein